MGLFHGGGASYLGAEPVTNYRGQLYNAVLATHDGFNPKEPDTMFLPVDYVAKLADGSYAGETGLANL